MERVLAVKFAVFSCLALLLAACSNTSGGNGAIFKAALAELFPKMIDSGANAGPAPAPALTRAAVEAAGVALIRIRLETEDARSTMQAVSEADGYVTHLSQFAQMVTLRGGLVTASRGLGFDLLAVEAANGDPLVRQTPLGAWPGSVTRIYHFPGQGPEGQSLPVTCRYVPGERLSVEIVEITYQGQQVEEICEGRWQDEPLSFTNDLFVIPETGMIWRSFQWLGPEQGRLDLTIIEPFTGPSAG